jgi:UDP-glucuronate decarboxylase
MQSTQNIIEEDLEYICSNLDVELLQMSGKRLLITGGAGFLGYYLVQTILHWNSHYSTEPVKIVVYDNFSRGLPSWINLLYDNEYIDIVKYDVIEPLPCDMGDFSYIMHAATIASPTYYRLHPVETMDANINGLRNLLEYCLKHNSYNKEVEGLLFFSTSEIYGDPHPDNIPTPETYKGNVSCTGPRACYDESKRYGETLCVNFAQQYGVPVRIARPFNNYGPGLKITDKRALPDFARNVLNGEDIVMFSNGTPTRTFCYVTDAVIGYFKILVRGRNGESYNIGSDKPEISIRELAERTIETSKDLFNYQGKLVFNTSSDMEYLIDNPNRRCPNIDKVRKELDYNPSISLEKGLRNSLIWYSENHNIKEEK